MLLSGVLALFVQISVSFSWELILTVNLLENLVLYAFGTTSFKGLTDLLNIQACQLLYLYRTLCKDL